MRAVFSLLFVALFAVSAANESQLFSEIELLAHSFYKQFVDFLAEDIKRKDDSEQDLDEESRLSFTAYQEPAKSRRAWTITASDSFSYSNCADPDSELAVPRDLSIKPDPLTLPGNVTIGGSVLIKEPLDTPLRVQLEVEYKMWPGIWVDVPCIENIGSCTYDDFCQMITVEECPVEIEDAGLKCSCPFPKGDFTVDSLTLYVSTALPVSGQIRVKATVTHLERLVTCASVELDLD